MRCAACGGGLPPGKVLFCPPCFFSLPRKEQGECVAQYVRVAKLNGGPVDGLHPGMRDKVAKLAKMIRSSRGLTGAPQPAPVPGTILVDAPVRTDAMTQFNRGQTQ